MRLRAQPPVHSPIGPAALLAGLQAAVFGSGTARTRVERLLIDRYQSHGVILTDSGTTALTLALRLAVAERPGPVALPAYCCYDIATATDAAGTDFILYDIDPHTLGPDPLSLRRAIDRGARVILAVHLYGIPVDLASIDALAGPASAVVIEDAAQAAGASLGGRPVGSLGRYAVLSFGRGKGMTGGRGGALLVNARDASARVPEPPALVSRSFASGRDAASLLAQWMFARPSLYWLPLSVPFLRLGETIYRKPAAPDAPSPFALGTLLRTLDLVEVEAEQRRANAAWLREQIFEQTGIAAPRAPVSAIPGFLRMPVVVESAALPRFRSKGLRSLGVWPGYPTALSDLAGFGSRRVNREEDMPGARTLAARLFTLPTHSLLDAAARRALAALLSQAKS